MDPGNSAQFQMGYGRITHTYDSKGLLIEKRYSTIDNQAVLTKSGHSLLKMNYDEEGRIIAKRFYDAAGHLVLDSECNCSGFDYKYDPSVVTTALHGPSTVTLIGLDGKAGRNNSGISSTKFIYDMFGRCTEEQYFDEGDSPTAGLQSFDKVEHRLTFSQSDNEYCHNLTNAFFRKDLPAHGREGYSTESKYYDLHGVLQKKLFIGRSGIFDTCEKTYDGAGHLLSEKYLKDHQPVDTDMADITFQFEMIDRNDLFVQLDG